MEYTEQVKQFIDEQAIKIVKGYDRNLTDDQARCKIGYVLAKKALESAYNEGFAQGVHIQREWQ